MEQTLLSDSAAGILLRQSLIDPGEAPTGKHTLDSQLCSARPTASNLQGQLHTRAQQPLVWEPDLQRRANSLCSLLEVRALLPLVRAGEDRPGQIEYQSDDQLRSCERQVKSHSQPWGLKQLSQGTQAGAGTNRDSEQLEGGQNQGQNLSRSGRMHQAGQTARHRQR